MAYAKGFTNCEDFPLGIQSVNRAIDNNSALYTTWSAKHGVTDYGSMPLLSTADNAKSFGRHNDVLVSRSVSNFVVVTDDGGDKYLSEETTGRMVRGIQRLGTGQWRIYTSAVDIFGAVAVPNEKNAANLKATCRVVSNVGNPPVGLTGYVDVSTWNVTSAAREDSNFSLVLWGVVP